jgi:hypothetical protein
MPSPRTALAALTPSPGASHLGRRRPRSRRRDKTPIPTRPQCLCQRERVPVFAVVDDAAISDGHEGGVRHVVGVAVGDDVALDAPLADDGVRAVGRVDLQRVDLVHVDDLGIVAQVFEDRDTAVQAGRRPRWGEWELDQDVLGAKIRPGSYVLSKERVQAAPEQFGGLLTVAHHILHDSFRKVQGCGMRRPLGASWSRSEAVGRQDGSADGRPAVTSQEHNQLRDRFG